jgi:integrase/recombinase XerD
MNVKSFKQYLESEGKSRSTVSHYHSYALDFLAFLDRDHTEIDNATAKEVLSYLNLLKQKGQENKTRNIRLNVIKQYFDYQIQKGERLDNPARHLKIRGSKKQKLYPLMDRMELDRLYAGYLVPEEDDPRSSRNWFKPHRLSKARNKAILSLMIHQGLTTPEINRLRPKDLKLKEGIIFIKGSRKSNERSLELKSHQIIELMEYSYTTREALLKYCKAETKHLFLSTPPIGKDYNSRSDCKEIWKRFSQELKAQDQRFINFKQVRTSVISLWLKTHNLREVQVMAGHRYISSTEAYLVNQIEDLQADIDAYYPF